MDKYSGGLKRVTSNPGPAKAKPSNAVADGGDSIAKNKIGSAPSLHSKINSDPLPPVPSRNKTTENLQGLSRNTTELDSKKLLVPKTNSRPLSEGPSPPKVNQQLPPVAPRKFASTSPTSSGEFMAAVHDARANNNVQSAVPPPTAPRKVATLVESGPPKVSAVVPPPTAPRNVPISAIIDARPMSMSPTLGRNAVVAADPRPVLSPPLGRKTPNSLQTAVPAVMPPPTAPRNVPPSVDPRPMRNTPSSQPEITATSVPPPTAPRNMDTRPMSPPPTRNTPSIKPETAAPPPPKVDSKPKLTVPLLTSPRNSNDSDKSPAISPREGKPPSPVVPRVPTAAQNIKPEELPSVPPRNPTNSNNPSPGSVSPVVGRNNPAAAAKKSSNPSTPSTSGEFIIPKANSGPTIPRVNTPPPVAPRTPTDSPSNPTTIVPPPTAPRKVGERVPSTEITDQPIKPAAVHGHGALASSMPTRSAPLHHELRTSTPTTSTDKTQVVSYAPSTVVLNPVVFVSSAPPKGPAPAPPKARTDAIENIKATSNESIPPIKQHVETTEADSGTKGSPRPKSGPIKVPAIQANMQRKTADDTLSPRSAVISPRTPSPRSPKSPTLSPSSDTSPNVIERPLSSPPIIGNTQPALTNVPAIVIEEEPKPQPSSFKYSKPLLPPPVEDQEGLDQGVTSSVRPPSPREDNNEVDQTQQGFTRYTKSVRPPTPREDEDEPTGLAPSDSDSKRASVYVDIDPILMTLSPRTLQQKLSEVEENGFYGTGLDYYLDPENQPDFTSDVQPDFTSDFQDEGDGLSNSDEPGDVKEARKSAWVKVTKPKSTVPRGDIAKPDIAKVRGTIDPDELPTRRVSSVMIANRIINEDEPPEEDSGNEKDGPPVDVPAGPNENVDSESSDDGENKAAKKAIKDLKKIQKFFTKVIPKKLGINKEDGDSSDSSDGEGKSRTKGVAVDDSTLTPEEREARRKQLEEEERIRKEEKERRKQEKERLKREQKEREEKEKEERDKIKQAEREEKEKLRREEKVKEDKEKEERDKIKQAEKEKEDKEKEERDKIKQAEKERLKKEKEEQEAKEREDAEKNKPSPGIANFKVDKKAPNIAKVLPKLSEDDANRLNHATVDRPAFKGRRPPTRVLRPGIITTEGDNEIEGQAAPTPATPMEL